MSKEQKAVAAPGKVVIRYVRDDYNQDWGEAKKYQAGETLQVDAEKAKRIKFECGDPVKAKVKTAEGDVIEKTTAPGCPFEIIAENKALAGADETK